MIVNDSVLIQGSLDIDLAPTIIFYRNNSELGRIVEVPNQSLEEDMLNIITISE